MDLKKIAAALRFIADAVEENVLSEGPDLEGAEPQSNVVPIGSQPLPNMPPAQPQGFGTALPAASSAQPQGLAGPSQESGAAGALVTLDDLKNVFQVLEQNGMRAQIDLIRQRHGFARLSEAPQHLLPTILAEAQQALQGG